MAISCRGIIHMALITDPNDPKLKVVVDNTTNTISFGNMQGNTVTTQALFQYLHGVWRDFDESKQLRLDEFIMLFAGALDGCIKCSSEFLSMKRHKFDTDNSWVLFDDIAICVAERTSGAYKISEEFGFDLTFAVRKRGNYVFMFTIKSGHSITPVDLQNPSFNFIEHMLTKIPGNKKNIRMIQKKSDRGAAYPIINKFRKRLIESNRSIKKLIQSS